MKPCIVIPCFNHTGTVAAVALAAQAHAPVLVVDDGSTQALPELPGCAVLRCPKNGGKGAALRVGFKWAADQGFTHAITMDADGQHSASDLEKFIARASAQPDALIVGVRDLAAAGAPIGRQRSNRVSSFWFRVESGVRLRDTQCGFRCYPLALAQRLRARSGRYAFELEFLVRAAWLGVQIVAVPVACSYQPEQLRNSHFRPVADLAHITFMNIGLVLQSWFIPQPLRAAWSVGRHLTLLQVVQNIFAENTHEPGRLAAAVGLGLFCGIAPIWGFQMLLAAALAHRWKLNKAIALLASNISIPPLAPFFIYGGLALGHWMFTGHGLAYSAHEISRSLVLEYLWQWCVGSVALGLLAGILGTVATYGVARLVRKK